MNKSKNIIFRIDQKQNNLLKIKSTFFKLKKSELLRKSFLTYWENQNISFKKIRDLYKLSNTDIKYMIIEVLFYYYRKNGYPYIALTQEQKINRMERLIKTKDILLNNNYLKQNTVAMDLANSFHPHMAKMKKTNGKISPMDTFNSDIGLKDCIKTWLDLGNVPNHAGIRRILKTRNKTQSIHNFRPTVSKFIYDKYTKLGNNILDPCAGFSSRLLGSIACNKHLHYYGIDPDERTIVGNTKCSALFYENYNFTYTSTIGCAEDIMQELPDNKYNLVFTSPPYFDLEEYSYNIKQSFIKYPEYKIWKEEFLNNIIKESKRVLKNDGKLILNVKNIKKKYNIADDTLLLAKKIGLNLEEIYYIMLSNSEFNRSSGNNFHTEPIFVWNKK